MRALTMLRRRHIAVLWTSQWLSSMGDYFYLVAVMWTAAKLAGSAAGLVASAESGAALAVATLGGVVADRFDRRWAMIVADVGRGLAVAVLGVFALRGSLGVVPMVVVALVLGVLDAIFTPALLASVPALTEHPGELQATSALMDATRRIARAIGPSVAGTVAAAVSVGSFFLIDALTFCASGAAIFTIGSRLAAKAAPDESRPGARGRVVADVKDALGVVVSSKKVTWAFGSLFLVNVAWAAGFQVGGVLLASRALATGIAGYSYLVGAYGAGNVAGNLVAGSVHIERKLATMFTARLILGAGFVILAAAPSLPIAMAGAAIAAFGGPMAELPLVSLLYTEFPAEKAGRIFSLRFMLEHGGVALGLVAAAPLFAGVPVRLGIAACGAVIAGTGVAGFWRFGTKG